MSRSLMNGRSSRDPAIIGTAEGGRDLLLVFVSIRYVQTVSGTSFFGSGTGRNWQVQGCTEICGEVTAKA